MSKHVKEWLCIYVSNGIIYVEGTESKRKQGDPDNSECWLALSPKEVAWLRDELSRAVVTAVGTMHP